MAGIVFEMGGNITDSQQFDATATGSFFLRMCFTGDAGLPALRDALAPVMAALSGDWRPVDVTERPRVLILVSRQDHCLADLPYRRRIGELPMEVVGVVSNHPMPDGGIPDLGRIPFHHLPVTAATRDAQEAQIKRIVSETATELVVLARYMQILSEDLCRFLSGRCINIHHSFLPSFKGAKPYHQAHARGVKMIGATAHYVTEDLDEGPIIYQDVARVTHADDVDSLIRKGRGIEQRVLAEAVRVHVLRGCFRTTPRPWCSGAERDRAITPFLPAGDAASASDGVSSPAS